MMFAKDSVCLGLQMAIFMRVNGLKIKGRVKVKSNGQMDLLSKVNFRRVRRMVLDILFGLMARFTRVTLKIICSMVKEIITMLILVKLTKESLCMEKFKDWDQNNGKMEKLTRAIFLMEKRMAKASCTIHRPVKLLLDSGKTAHGTVQELKLILEQEIAVWLTGEMEN